MKKRILSLLTFCIVTFIIVAYFVMTNRLQVFDKFIITYIQSGITSLRTIFMYIFTQIGSAHYAIIIILLSIFIFYLLKIDKVKIITFIVIVATTPLINIGIKMIFKRTRPSFNQLIEQGGYSFPSGHSMNAFVLYTMIIILLWGKVQTIIARMALIIISVSFIVLIGVSRIYLGVHFPTDIIAGYIAGAAWILVILLIVDWITDKNN